MVAVSQTWEFGGLRLDLTARTLLGRRGEEITLRRSEYELLLTFVRHPGQALSRDFLLEAVVGRRSNHMIVVLTFWSGGYGGKLSLTGSNRD